jgi:putative transposase
MLFHSTKWSWLKAWARQGDADSVPRSRNFAAELRDECLNGEIFYSLKEATVVIEQWRNQYNTIRPHSSLNYRPPAPQTSTALSLHLDRSHPMQ